MRRIVILAAIAAVFVLAVLVRVKMINAEARAAKEGVETIQRREGYLLHRPSGIYHLKKPGNYPGIL